MFKFIKTLFGFGPKETAPTAAPYKVEPATQAVASTTVAVATAPARKNRRPRNRNKARAGGGTVANINQAKPAVTEGKTKGGNNVVKQQSSNSAKPDAPAKVAKVKSTKPKQPAR